MRAGERAGVDLHQFELFAPHARLLACCSGRRGGVSKPPYDTLNVALHVEDDLDSVVENRSRLASELSIEVASLVIPRQVHGDRVASITARDRGRGATSQADAIADSDALITKDAGVALAVMIADCVPVLIFDPQVSAVGVAHAGWRGSVRHVARNTVAAMQREFGSDPGTLLAGIGPSIGPASYVVDADVADRAETAFPGAGVTRATGDGGFLLDLWACNVADLVNAGVPPENVEVAGIDTYQRVDRFFSHRRGAPTGRFLAVAMLRL